MQTSYSQLVNVTFNYKHSGTILGKNKGEIAYVFCEKYFMKYFFYNMLLLFLTNTCFAQQQYTFTNYKEVEGLPSGLYWGMFKDTTGFLWLYSEQGIARFDGYNFKIFRHNPDDSTSIPNSDCSNGMQVANGDIYFNFEGGARLYDTRKLSFTRQFAYKNTEELFDSYTVKSDSNALYLFSANNLIRVRNSRCDYFPLPEKGHYRVSRASNEKSDLTMLNFSGKIFVFKGNTIKFDQLTIYDRSGKLDTTVFDIFYRPEENNFIAISKKHLYSFNKNTNCFIPSLDLHLISSVELIWWGVPVQYNNNYFVCTSNGKLYKLNIETGEEKIIHLNKKIPEHKVKDKGCAGVIDKKGMLWIRSFNMGLFRYDIATDQYEQFINESGNPGSLPSNDVFLIIPDNEGMAWIGCRLHGLVKMEPVLPVMERLSPPSNKRRIVFGNEDKNIRTFLETESGYLVGTLQGLLSYNEEKKAYNEETGLFGLGEIPIGALERDLSGNTWVGTWSGQLRILNPENNRHISLSPFLTSNIRVRDLFCDSKNTMWIATQEDGIYTVNANEIDFDNPASLKFNPISNDKKNASTISSNIIYTLKEDGDGNIWAGADNGLNHYDRSSKKWTRYANIAGDQQSIHGNDVRSLAFDKKGILWIGTNGGGLNRYNKAENKFTHFTKENGLPNDAIYTILCDNNGMLWLGTNHGLCRFNPDDYSCKNFTLKDGLQNYEFNTEAALKLKDGRLLFGGVDGYNVIDPTKIENLKSIPPPVVISSIKIFDREVPPGDGYLKLKYTENNLTFEFAALSFYRNQDNRYAYKMEGIDPDWIYSNDRRFVTYSNIEPGDYIFKVKACNSDGVWNETGTQLAITITPPWWRTWWMYVFYFVTAVSFIIGFIKWRERNVKKEKVILENKITDATKQIRIEKERAEQSEKFKQQFLANMSHEIRTPMNAVMGMTNLVLDTELNPKQKKYLTGVKNASENLLHIINEILDLSKVEAGKMELEEIDFSIRDVVEQVYQVLKHKADEKSIELIISVNSNVPKVAVGDPVRLYQILMNLAGNAIKFTDKGSVQLAVDSLPLATASAETSNLKLQTLNFCVIDTGIGIPQDKLQTIFDSFSQAHSSDSRKYGGTGLGLSISKQFIKLMGGKLIVESVVNSGSTFSFALNLPIGSSENLLQQKSSEEIDGNILDGLKILLVDDNSDNRIVCRDTLESKSKVIIEEATNGQEAILLLSEKDFDVVLMDVQMPVMDGYTATRQIRNLASPVNIHKIPVIALTASVIRSDLDKCRAAGMNDYVPKPFRTSELIAAIAKATGREIKFASKKENQIKHDIWNNSSVTNLSYLEKFCEGDKKQMQKYITMFKSSAPDLNEKLMTALSKNDFEEIANQVHGYKTKWIMMGMNASNDLAMTIEQQCREKEPGKSIKENVLTLIEQIQIATKELT